MGSGAGRTTLGLAPTLSLTGMSPVREGDRPGRGPGPRAGRAPQQAAGSPVAPARPEALQAKSGPSPLGTANNGLRLLPLSAGKPRGHLHLGQSPPQTLATAPRMTREGSSLWPCLSCSSDLGHCLSVWVPVGGSLGRDPGKVGERASQGEGEWGSEPDTRVGVPASGCAHGGQSLPTQGASRQRQALPPTPSSWMPLLGP